MFEELPIQSVALGTQHAVALTTDSVDKKELPDFEESVVNFVLTKELLLQQDNEINKKRTREEFENGGQESEEEKDG
jgi:hypothetical protein